MIDAHLNGVRNAAAAGWRVLERGGSCIDAVEAAGVVMEEIENLGQTSRLRGREFLR